MNTIQASIFKGFDQLVDELLSPATKTHRTSHFNPSVRITETDERYHIELLAPGRSKEQFELSLEKQLLTIQSAEVKQEPKENTKVIRNEYQLPAFKRSFNLDNQIDTSSISAGYTDGILLINLPKKAKQEPEKKQISVQ